jgi:hypothetical protein
MMVMMVMMITITPGGKLELEGQRRNTRAKRGIGSS